MAPVEADLGGPLWQLGMRWYSLLDDGRLLTVRTFGTDTLAVLDPATGSYDDIDLGNISSVHLGARRRRPLLLGPAASRTVAGLRVLDLGDRAS